MTDPRTHPVAETYDVHRILRFQAGFVLELVTFREPKGDVAFHRVLGRT